MTGGEIKMEHCSTKEQVADLFTKSLPLEKFVYLKREIRCCRFLHLGGAYG